MAQRHPEAEARLLVKWICMKCSATVRAHGGVKPPKSCRKCGYTFSGGVWEPYTRASDANKRIVRRSLEGATATDMTVIAQQAALEFERKISERETDEGTEEE